MQNAAESWNLELGTTIQLAPPGTADGEQIVHATFSELVCAYAGGIGDSDIYMCPSLAEDRRGLFRVLRHEIGHVVGIRAHAEDEESVMAAVASDRFTDEDRGLFAEFNPTFTPARGCDVAPVLVTSAAPPIVLQRSDDPLVVWAVPGQILVATLPPQGRTPVPLAAVDVPAFVQPIRAQLVGGRLLLMWSSLTRWTRAWVDLDDGAVVGPDLLPLEEADSTPLGPGDMSAVAAGSSLFIALSRLDLTREDPESLRIVEIDLASNTLVRSSTHSGLAGGLVLHAGEPYLVTASSGTVNRRPSTRVGRLVWRSAGPEPGFETTGGLELVQPINEVETSATFGVLPTVVSMPWGLAVVVPGFPKSRLLRLRVDPVLAVTASRPIDVQPWFDGAMVALLEHDGALHVAASRRVEPGQYTDEIHLLQLHPETLELQADWRRLSAPDTDPSLAPQLTVLDGQVTVLWQDGFRTIRRRCSPR